MTGLLHMPSTRKRLTESWEAAPEHLRPVIEAVRDHRAGLLFVSQDTGPFRLPKRDKRPAVVILGDDMEVSKGPTSFHLPSVRRIIRECDAFAVVSSDPDVDVYASLAARAALGGRVMIVETRVIHEIAWVELIRKTAPRRLLIWSTVKGGEA